MFPFSQRPYIFSLVLMNFSIYTNLFVEFSHFQHILRRFFLCSSLVRVSNEKKNSSGILIELWLCCVPASVTAENIRKCTRKKWTSKSMRCKSFMYSFNFGPFLWLICGIFTLNCCNKTAKVNERHWELKRPSIRGRIQS